MERPSWVKDKTTGKEYEVIQAPHYDDYKDFVMEPSGYYALIKIHMDKHEIALAVCNSTHEIQKEFRGKRSQDILHCLFSFEKEHNLTWFTLKEHIAYLGRELKKAEMHLAMGNSGYYQE
jgi:hypothetical protein